MVCRKHLFTVFVFISVILITSCSRQEAKNNKIAYIVIKDNNNIHLLITGKRVPMVHDLMSILNNKLIDDTLFLRIPTMKNGIINGKEIPVEEYYNTYQGYILINNKKVTVDLQIVDIDSKKIVAEPYNGTYDLEILK